MDQILVGARQNSLKRSLLGGVSAKVASEASCTVTVVRPRRPVEAGFAGSEPEPGHTAAALPDPDCRSDLAVKCTCGA